MLSACGEWLPIAEGVVRELLKVPGVAIRFTGIHNLFY